jgi:hypothetical protein
MAPVLNRVLLTCRSAALVTALWLACPGALRAQMIVTRNLMLTALDDSTGAGQFLPHAQFSAEVQGGFGSARGEQAWNIKLGGLLEFYRWGTRSALIGLAGHELTANPYNNISFNPRGAFWEESVLFLTRRAALDWHLGGFFRCRHELDNAEPPSNRVARAGYTPTSRLVILSGVQGGITSRELTITRRTSLRGFLRVEWYAFTSDERTPQATEGPVWEDAFGTTFLGGRWRYEITPSLTTYARAWGSVMYFARDRSGAAGIHPELNARLESGLRAAGARGGMDFYAAVERFFDDLSRPAPQRSTVLYIGVRAGSVGS